MTRRDSRLRICHILSSLQVGGAERIALRLAQVQARTHDVSLVAMRGGPLEVEAHRLGLPVMAGHGSLWRIRLQFAKHFALHGYDVVNSHNRHAQKYAVFGRRSAVVMTLHAECREDYGWALRRPWLDGVIAVSSRAADVFCQVHPDLAGKYPIEAIENGVAEEPTTRSRDAVRSDLGIRDEVVLVVVARLDPFKDLGTLLRAFALCRPSERPVRLLMVGEGPCRGELEALARTLELGNTVTFLGYRSDIGDVLSAADLFVLSSRTEGMPISVLEAMASSLPVVATAVGGVPELVEQGVTGLLVPPGDPSALADAILTVVSDAHTRNVMGAAGRERVVSRFTLQAMAARYEAFYLRAIARRRAAVR